MKLKSPLWHALQKTPFGVLFEVLITEKKLHRRWSTMLYWPTSRKLKGHIATEIDNIYEMNPVKNGDWMRTSSRKSTSQGVRFHFCPMSSLPQLRDSHFSENQVSYITEIIIYIFVGEGKKRERERRELVNCRMTLGGQDRSCWT